MTKDILFFKDLPESAWSPIEKITNLIIDLASKDVSKLTGRGIHVENDKMN